MSIAIRGVLTQMAYLGEYNKDSSYYEAPREEMLAFMPDTSKLVLDIGCSNGFFGRNLKSKSNVIVHGIEINNELKEIASKNIDEIFIGDVFDGIKYFSKNKYDSIFFNDVLEHFMSPDKVLIKLKPILSESGVIIASIPNIRYFRTLKSLIFERDFKYEDSGILDNTHLRFFTKKSMMRLFDNSGYDVSLIKGINKTKSLKPYFFHLLSFGLFGLDTVYLQFAIIAKKKA